MAARSRTSASPSPLNRSTRAGVEHWSQAGVNWNEYPDGCKRGRVAVRLTGERETVYVDRRTGREETTTAVRSWWETSAAPHFTTSSEGWLAATIPMMPSFAPAAV
ncbi:hypothetical protein ABZY81_43830 [Streptomyces sp. NPDC006514]|uniref:hypothetical protein n=1 Tax=Streptomyces sp. NPDC006514 TaxID=3154308 RepID=UPI0033A54203